MTARGRGAILLSVGSFVVALAIVLQPPPIRSSFDWRWRDAAPQPFATTPKASPGEVVAVRVLGDGADAAYAAELLWGAGLLGVAPGASSSHGEAEVLLVPATECPPLPETAVVVVAPCASLSEALGLPGLVTVEHSAPEGFVEISSDRRAGHLPLPGTLAEWSSSAGWTVVARRTGGGAVVLAQGRVVAFSFDVVAWLRSLRQGEPELADVDRDGEHGTKPNDLRPFPWSYDAWRSPGVDAWTELLAWAVGDHLQPSPLPRIWPLPTDAPSALVLTVDQDFAPQSWVEPLLARTEAAGGELTVLMTAGTRQNNSQAADGSGGEWPSADARRVAEEWGHGFGLHPNSVGLENDGVEAAIREHQRRFVGTTGAPPRTVRHHFLRWWGYDDPLRLQAELGFWMGLDFVSIEPRFPGPGFQFGSGRPLRPQRLDGSMLPILSQPTQVEDDVLTGDFGYSARLTSREAVVAIAQLMDAAVLWRVPVTANLHPLVVAGDQGRLLDGLLAAAVDRGLPIVSAERWAVASWARLHAVTSAPVVGIETSVPLRLWTPGGDCRSPVTASPFTGPGCLGPWPSPPR
jgi:hypothetical protein